MSPNFYSTMTNDQSPANVRQSKRKIPYNSNWMSESEYQQRLNRGNSYKNIVKQNLSKISTFKDLKIRVLSWNINSKVDSTMFLDEWILPDDLKYEKPDIFVFGFQEVDLSIGSVALNKTSSSLLEDRWVELIESSCDNLLNQKLRKILRNSKKDETDRSYYIQLKRVRMAGILLILYVSEKFKISHRIFDVAVSSIPTGIMNMMGNKGAVAMRFNYYNSSICIVNCHLAAGEGNIERRKQDFAEITRKLQFNLSTLNNKEGKRLTITDHDYIIFFGDLNFRLNTFNLDDVMKCIEQKRYDRLLEVDEIRSMSHELSNLDEAKIDFPPTYKFIVGTQRYDIGEKGRTPAYCDRILYQGENIKVDNYRSHASYTNSDHKPISAMVKIGAYRINRNLFNSFLDRLVHREDRELNKKLPQAVVTPLDVDFGQVQFFKIYEKEITITNTGQVDLEYIFQNDREVKMPDWMTVFPMKKVLKKGYSNVISIKIGIKDIHVAKLNKSGDRMSTILVLKLLEGKDIFICIYFNFQPTCFGLSLKTLVDIGDRPVGKIPHEELLQIINEARDRPDVAETPPLITFDTEEETEDTSKDFYIPKEIFRMVDFIKERIETPYLYERPGTETLFLSIQHTLNTTTVDQPFAEDIDVHTMISILNIFLSTIEDSIIPQKFQQAFIENSHKIQICMSIIATLPIINQNLIWYLLKFFNFTLKHSSLNGTSSVDIAKNYAEIFFRDDSANRSWDEKVICLQKMIEFQDL